ncbi:hypothetical protein C1752_03856 [Acaryochloris thomasi RCC1774]|uniref:RNA-binding protein n=1 Tax=Acaryochloris thomasi RCC1774 TaxID=1764569 RepID=A0A2W1JEX8_9CYAN|nr:NYN domain-containing protein [Acaryochloris thomasi]PZD72269.1 hypothetical protein C1752_03856 [Acaryochloris thomasi RCC1774]
MARLPTLTTLLVDGYNIIGAWPKLQKMRERNNLEAARDRLSEALSNYSAFRGYQTHLIFDAQFRAGQGSTEMITNLLHVFYTESGRTADTHIELYCAQARRGAERIRVATSDSAQKLTVMGYGAEWMSAQQLVADLEATTRSIQASQRNAKQQPGRLLAHGLDPEAKQRLEQLRFGR